MTRESKDIRPSERAARPEPRNAGVARTPPDYGIAVVDRHTELLDHTFGDAASAVEVGHGHPLLGRAAGVTMHGRVHLGVPVGHADIRLLGHEVAHALQQRNAPVDGGTWPDPDQIASLEAEADAAGEALACGQQFAVRGHAAPNAPLFSGEHGADPLFVYATSFQTAAKQVSDILASEKLTDSARIVVINGSSLQVYDQTGTHVAGPFRFKVPVTLSSGVFRAISKDRQLHAIVVLPSGRYAISPTSASGRADMSRDVDDQAAFDAALKGGAQIYWVIPEALTHKRDTPASPAEAQPEYMKFVAKHQANLPAWPAAVIPLTPQIATVSSTGSFKMVVEKAIGVNMLDMVTNVMEPTAFKWEVIKLDTRDKLIGTQRVTKLDGIKDAYARRLRHLKADKKTIEGDPGEQSIPETVIRGYIAEQMNDSRTILAMAGETVMSLLKVFSDTSKPNLEDFIDVPWTSEGEYFVRCLATPGGADAKFRRATSVAGVRVSVFDIGQAATESLGTVASERKQADERLKDFTDRKEEIQKLLDAGSGDAAENQAALAELELLVAHEAALSKAAGDERAKAQADLDFVNAQIAFCKGPRALQRNPREKAANTARQEALLARKKSLEAFLGRIDTKPGRDVIRMGLMPAVMVDEDTGERRPLLFAIGERQYVASDKLEVVIADVTDDKGGTFSGTGDGFLAARGRPGAWKAAMADLRKHLKRGRAYLAYRPPSPYDVLSPGVPNPMQLQLAFMDQAKEMVDDTVHALTLAAIVAAPFTEGASLAILGVVAPIAAGSSLYNILDRAYYGRLELDSECVMDLINIATVGLGPVGAARGAAKGGMKILQSGSRVAVQILNFGAFVIMTYQTFKECTAVIPGEDPREGRRRRLLALLKLCEGAAIPVAAHLWPAGAYQGKPGVRPIDEHNPFVEAPPKPKYTPASDGTAPGTHHGEGPPVKAPTVEGPPVKAPTVETPRVKVRTVEEPPVKAPTVEEPPARAPPVEVPPATLPTVESPPPPPPPPPPVLDWAGVGAPVNTVTAVTKPPPAAATAAEVAMTAPRDSAETVAQANVRRAAGWRDYVARTYDPKGRTQTELNRDVNPKPLPGETTGYAAERALIAQGEMLRRGIVREQQFTAAFPQAPTIDMAANDAAFHTNGAHTADRHGAGVPLTTADAPPAGKSIESRVINGDGWGGSTARQPRSFRWKSDAIMNQTLSDHIRTKWPQIMHELIVKGFCDHVGVPAGQVVGEGFVQGTQLPSGDWTAVPTHGTTFNVRIRLIDGIPPRIMILTSFPGP